MAPSGIEPAISNLLRHRLCTMHKEVLSVGRYACLFSGPAEQVWIMSHNRVKSVEIFSFIATCRDFLATGGAHYF